jgi:site-specific DNA-cytosine methylase
MPLLARACGIPSTRRPDACSASVPLSTNQRPHDTAMIRQFSLPAGMISRLDSWGSAMRSSVDVVRRSFGLSMPLGGALRIGTDCSGVDAPIWALRSLGVRHTHVFSCDSCPQARAFIRLASPPAVLFDDMLNRDLAAIPDIDVYVNGFPCTPYSMLRRHQTRLLKEPAAKPYFKTLEVLRAKLPAMAVLENVQGIRRVMPKIKQDLLRLKAYNVYVIDVDSAMFGEPVARPRVYFLLVRVDMGVLNVDRTVDFLQQCLTTVAKPVIDHVADIMLPNSHPYVHQTLSRFAHAGSGVRGSNRSRKAKTLKRKWVEDHKRRRASRTTSTGSTMTTGVTHMLSERQLDLCNLLTAEHPGKDLVVDVSQSAGRAHVHTRVCPTIATGSRIFVKKLDRTILPIEKLLLHGFPLHKMKIPATLTDDALSKLGGAGSMCRQLA